MGHNIGVASGQQGGPTVRSRFFSTFFAGTLVLWCAFGSLLEF